MNFKIIEERAVKLLSAYLEHFDTELPPVPIAQIAERFCNLRIYIDELDEDTSGKLFIQEKILLLNSTDSLYRQRFTIAHELGHFYLHNNTNSKNQVCKRKKDTGPEDNTSHEREANVFASRILMPANLVYKCIIIELIEMGIDLTWLLHVDFDPLKDFRLYCLNDLIAIYAFENKELLIPLITRLSRKMRVSKEAVSWRLKELGFLGQFLEAGDHSVLTQLPASYGFDCDYSHRQKNQEEQIALDQPKCENFNYIHFLISVRNAFIKAGQCQTKIEDAPTYDTLHCLLQKPLSDAKVLWQEAKALVKRKKGVLVLDETALDKPHAPKTNLVTYHWRKWKRQRLIRGIHLLSLLWTDGKTLIPCDFRVYDKLGGGQKNYKHFEELIQMFRTKNKDFKHMLSKAKEQGFEPECVLLESWYASLKTLKRVRYLGWNFLARLEGNRLVNFDGGRVNTPICQLKIHLDGLLVHLKRYGAIKMFMTNSLDGKEEYWATNDLTMTEEKRKDLVMQGWGIEVHRFVRRSEFIPLAYHALYPYLNHVSSNH